MEEISLCKCGSKAQMYIWSASPTLFIQCTNEKCNITTGGVTRKELKWAEVAVIREWNRLVSEEIIKLGR